MKILVRLVLLAGAVAVFALLLRTTYSDVRARTIADLNTQQMIIAKQVSIGIRNYFEHYHHVLSFLADSPSVLRSTAVGLRTLRDYYKYNRNEIKAVTRVGPDGKIVHTVPFNPQAIGADISSQEHVQAIMTNHKPVVSDVFKAVQGYRAVAYHVPVFDDDKFEGTLAVLIPFEILAKKFLTDIRIGTSGYAWVISRKGIELFCPESGHVGHSAPGKLRNYPAVSSMLKNMMAGRTGVATTRGHLEGDSGEVVMHGAYCPISMENNFWSIAVISSEDEILETLVGFRNKLIWLMVIILISGLAYSYFLIKSWVVMREEENRVLTERALARSEENYRQLIQSVNSIILRLDTQGRITFLNDFALRLFGYSAQELLGRNIVGTIVPETESSGRDLRQMIKDLLADPEKYAFNENENLRRNGERIWVSWTNRAVFGDSGELIELLAVGNDVSERRQAEERLRVSESLFRGLVENLPFPVAIGTIDRRTEYLNPRFVKVFGYEIEEIPDQASWRKKLFPDPVYRRAIDEEMAKWVASGTQTTAFERVMTDKNGVQHEAVIHVINLVDRFYNIIEDLTDRRKIERMLRHSQKMEAVGTLSSGIAHDFNNILQAISGNVQLLSGIRGLSGKGRKYAAEIDEAAHRASEMVQRLLTFSRKVEPDLKALDLGVEISRGLSLLTRTIPKMIRVETDLAADLRPINADANQLNQVLMNLATNARDAMPNGGRLVIRARNVSLPTLTIDGQARLEPGDYVVLEVEDTGSGIDENLTKQIFDPFFTTKLVGQGTGLGLSIVYGILAEHQAQITCASQLGQGTTFTIYFPALDGDEQPDHRSAAGPREKATAQGTETILVVDDEEAILELAREVLERFGYLTMTAASGEEALDKFTAAEGSIDLIIMDLGMPGMGGLACLKRLRELDPEVRVVIASGYAMTQQANLALEAGAVDFVNKPYRLNEMVEKIRSILDQ